MVSGAGVDLSSGLTPAVLCFFSGREIIMRLVKCGGPCIDASAHQNNNLRQKPTGQGWWKRKYYTPTSYNRQRSEGSLVTLGEQNSRLARPLAEVFNLSLPRTAIPRREEAGQTRPFGFPDCKKPCRATFSWLTRGYITQGNNT